MSGHKQGGSIMSALPRHVGRLPAANKGGFSQDLASKSVLSDRQLPGRMLNLMFDPRVIRGSTRIWHKQSDQPCHDPVPVKRTHKGKIKHAETGSRALTESCTARKHLNIQTDAYLEELVENVIEYDIGTQTDSFLDRPPTPLFIPQKSGPDIGTQIEEGDLFNFEEEVEPMVEVLVGRTLEQAMMEVMEEKQIANLHAYQEHFEQIRSAELVATQRMEAAERRILEEKRKRVQQEKRRLEEEQKVKEKVL